MRSFREIREQVGAGIDWCLCPSCKARQFVFFSSPALVDAEGGEEALCPQLALNMFGAPPETSLEQPGDQPHDLMPSPSVRTAGIKSCGDKKKNQRERSLDFVVEYISSYFVQTRCIPQSFLRRGLMHLFK